MMKPRDTICWDEYFFRLALVAAQKSKDPHTQVGSVIVDSRNCIVSLGFNGPPPGIPDDMIPWDREGDSELNKKYIWISHSEANSISFAESTRLVGSRIYVNLFPCAECAKKIIQAGIVEVVYLDDKYHDTESCIASRAMLDWAGIKYRKYELKEKSFIVEFKT